ncbi:MAG: hypothetical protein U5L01_02575 [Rheinheimera sp.]|nr:hypothetical protein [Rheinheimera sp.]
MMLRVLFWILFISIGSMLPVLANQIQSVRIWPSPDSTRVVFDLASKPEFSLQPRKNDELLLIIDDIEFTSLGQMTGESELVKSIKSDAWSDKKVGEAISLVGTSAEKPSI